VKRPLCWSLIALLLFQLSGVKGQEASGKKLVNELLISGRLGLSDLPASNIFLNDTCMSAVTQRGTVDEKLKFFCEVVTKSDHCKSVPAKDLWDCKKPPQNAFSSGIDLLKGCAIGVFRSASEFLNFIWEGGKFIWENLTDFNQASQTVDKASEFANSIKLYIYTEYDKAYDKASFPKGINAGRAVAEKMLSFVVNKLLDAIKENYYEFGCLHQEAKSERLCKLVGDFIVPPAALFAFLKKGAQAAKTYPGLERGLAKLKGHSRFAPYSARLEKAQRILGRPLNVSEQEAIIAAHLVGAGELGANGALAQVGNYTLAQIRQKAQILRQKGFSSDEIRKLMEGAVVGLDGEEIQRIRSFFSLGTPKAPIAPPVSTSPVKVNSAPSETGGARINSGLLIGGHPDIKYEKVRSAFRSGKIPDDPYISFQSATGDRFAGKIESVNGTTGEVIVDIGGGARVTIQGEQLATVRLSETARTQLRSSVIKLESHPEANYQVIREALNRGMVPQDPYVSFQYPNRERFAGKIESVDAVSGEVTLLLESGGREVLKGDLLQTIRQSSASREAFATEARLTAPSPSITSSSSSTPSPTGAREILSGQKMIESQGLMPKHEFAARNVKYKVSDFFTDGDGRIFVITDVIANGQVHRRVFYRSNSSASFRNLPARNKNIQLPGYDKGPGEEFLAAPPELQAFIAGKLDNAPAINDLPKLDPENLEGIIPVNRNIQDYISYNSNPQGIGQITQRREILGSVGRPLEADNGSMFAKPQDVQIANPMDRPDFTKPKLSYKLKTDIYGEVEAFVYHSKNGELEYTLLKDKTGRVWFSDIGAANADINHHGLRSKGISSEELLMPRWEYTSQIPGPYSGALHPQKRNYSDSWNYIRAMPEIRRWYGEQGLPIP
jgi:hypothetical protein